MTRSICCGDLFTVIIMSKESCSGSGGGGTQPRTGVSVGSCSERPERNWSWSLIIMASFPPSSVGEVLGLVAAMDAALLPCLPARELQAADRSSHPSLHVDVERHSKEFMNAAKKIQLFLVRVGHQYQPSREYVLRKEIAALEEELKIKDDLMQRQLELVSKWKQLLRSQNAASTEELVKV